MHPLSFVRAHPVATVTLMATGMMIGPAILRTINNVTGVSVGLPNIGNGGG